MTTTLNHIAEQAVSFMADDPDGGSWLQHILQLLDTKGAENEHLANPLNRDPHVYYQRPRDKALTGAEVVHGDFLALDYCGHTPSMTLFDYPRIEELETVILGGAGILNQFTTYLLAFREGRIAPYDVFYDSPSGERVRFTKRDQFKDSAAVKTVYPNPEIRWR